jgi:hypothetical protein
MRKSINVRVIFSEFAIGVEREELSDVVLRMTWKHVFHFDLFLIGSNGIVKIEDFLQILTRHT